MAGLGNIEQTLILDGRASDLTPVVIEAGNDTLYITVAIGNFAIYTLVDSADVSRLNAALRGVDWELGKGFDTFRTNVGWLKWRLDLETKPARSVTFNLEHESIKIELLGELWGVRVFDDFDTLSASEYDSFGEALVAAYANIAGRKIVSNKYVGISTIEVCDADQIQVTESYF